MSVKNDVNGGEEHMLLLTRLNQHRAKMSEWSKSVFHSRNDATSIPGYKTLVVAGMGSNPILIANFCCITQG